MDKTMFSRSLDEQCHSEGEDPCDWPNCTSRDCRVLQQHKELFEELEKLQEEDLTKQNDEEHT
jgi:hypothetical protein